MTARKSGGSKGRSGSSGRKSGSFNREGIEGLAADKPVVYRLTSAQGTNLYTGSAKRGRVQERLLEHLPGSKDAVRGASRVEISQKASINEAQKAEARVIAREKPTQNEKGK